MKYLVLFITLLLLPSCAALRWEQVRNNVAIVNGGFWAKDKTSGLCLLVTDGHNGVGLTCVPCDSLRGVYLVPVKVGGVVKP